MHMHVVFPSPLLYTLQHPQNTYQLILTTDEISTYAIFIYDTLEWSVGNGLGPSTSGFNAGNKVDGLNMTPEDHSVYVYQVNLGQSKLLFINQSADRYLIAPTSFKMEM